MEIVTPLFTERNTQVFVRVPRVGLRLDVDSERIAQAIANLLSNASRYSEPGSPVWIQAEREYDRVRIVVKDEGTGIEPDRLAVIFEAFYQALEGARVGPGPRARDRTQPGRAAWRHARHPQCGRRAWHRMHAELEQPRLSSRLRQPPSRPPHHGGACCSSRTTTTPRAHSRTRSSSSATSSRSPTTARSR